MEGRVEAVKSSGVCFSCLHRGHVSRSCRKRAKCATCQRSHPTLFHGRDYDFSTRRSREPSPNPQNDTISEATRELTRNLTQVTTEDSVPLRNSATKEFADNVCLSVVPVRLFTENKSILTYAFLDSGSTSCFITNRLFEELRPGRRQVQKTQITTYLGINRSTLVVLYNH